MTLRTRIAGFLLLTVCTTISFGVAHAQSYPSKSVRVIVPFPPGGISDALSRITAQNLSATFDQQFVVDNRPGAGTTIATDMVAKAPSEGYTIYFTDVTTHAINATLYTKLPYDSVKDFTQIALVAQSPLILVVHPSMPVKSVRELIALAKSKPDEITYASSGNGTILHLSTEAFKSMAGIKMVHVPYKGSAQAVAALLGGEATVSFSTTPAALPNIQAGKLRPLAVTSAKRSPVLPDVPALGETIKGYDILLYSGIMGPAGIPRDIVTKLHAELMKMLKQPKVQEQWVRYGATPVSMTPEQFTEHLKSDIAKLGKIVKASGAKID